MGKDLNGKELGTGLCQRKNGMYCGRYVDRSGKRKSIYNKDLRVLKKELTQAIYETQEGISVIDDTVILDDWFSKWLFVYKNDVIRENTKRHYMQIYTLHIKPYLGKVRISEITKFQCKELLGILKKDGYSWETQNKVKVILQDMFERALEDEFMKRNPMKGVRIPSNCPNERKVLTIDEQARFFECAAGTFYNNLFVVAINTGLRPGELFALTWDDIDLKNKEINVNKTLVYQKYLDDTCKTYHVEEPKTKTSNRKVPINSACEIALKKQFIQKRIVQTRGVKHTELSNCLFTSKFNTPLNSQQYSDAIKRIVLEVNLMLDDMEQIEMFSGHTFRHTFATRCIESGIAPKTLQGYLGHATLQMTMDLYVHNTDEQKKKEIEKLDHTIQGIIVTEDSINEKFDKLKSQDKNIVEFKTAVV